MDATKRLLDKIWILEAANARFQARIEKIETAAVELVAQIRTDERAGQIVCKLWVAEKLAKLEAALDARKDVTHGQG